jgi:acyl carrier protein
MGNSMTSLELHKLKTALIRVNGTFADKEILPATSIVDDLGIDSIRFVDLTIAIEDEFCIPQFPMQDWYDAEMLLSSRRFTVQSLLDICASCVAKSLGTAAQRGPG